MPDREPTEALHDVLGQLRIEGAIFVHAEYTEGWAYSSAPTHDLGRMLAPHASRVIPFHVVVSGRCWVEVAGIRYWATVGDVVVLPYGDNHQMGGCEAADAVEALSLLSPPPWSTMPVIRHGGGGALTQIACGFISSEARLFDPGLRAFPPVLIVTPNGPAARWVRASTEYALTRTALAGGDGARTPAALAELLFIEVLSLYLASAPAPETGFIRAAQDPVLAPALALIHSDPARKWTVTELARAATVSPSLLDERFRAVLGTAPIRYLTAWRMHLAQDLLRSSELGVATVAHRIGYESEEAFSRAFKRKHGIAPSLWRSR